MSYLKPLCSVKLSVSLKLQLETFAKTFQEIVFPYGIPNLKKDISCLYMIHRSQRLTQLFLDE